MMFLRVILFDCILGLFLVTVITQLIAPLMKREVTFPIFRKLVNKMSKPKKEPKTNE